MPLSNLQPPTSNLQSGALGGNRTPDALLRTEALCPLSYKGNLREWLMVNGSWRMAGTVRWALTINHLPSTIPESVARLEGLEPTA